MNIQTATHAFMSWGYLTINEGMRIVDEAPDKGDARSADVGCSANKDRFKRAVSQFKERWVKYGLEPNDELDEATIELMQRRFCDCPDLESVETRNASLRRWDSNALTWHGDVRVGDLLWSEAQTFTRNQVWGACNLLLEITALGRTNLRSYHARIDGPGGTLAQAYLPSRPSRAASETLTQEFDTAEGGRLSQHDFDLVTLHELCHSLGLSHDNSSAIALMDPYLNSELDGLQNPDKTELRARYGDPVGGTPTPQPPSRPTPEPEPPEEPDRCPPWARQLARMAERITR